MFRGGFSSSLAGIVLLSCSAVLLPVQAQEAGSEPVFKVSETWLTLAVIDWVVLMVAGWFLIRPAIADRSDSANSRFSAGVGVTHLGLVVGLVLMIWKPGA